MLIQSLFAAKLVSGHCRLAAEMGTMERLTFMGFLLRLASSLLLVALTWNPTGMSYTHWVASGFPTVQPLQAVVGLVLLGGWVFSVHATWRSLGRFGVLLGVALFAAVVWLLASQGWIDLSHSGSLGWMAVLLLSVLMAVGLSWSLVQRRVTGQIDVEESHGH
jgi:hypothetical protein